jgi:hypothetical protein
MVHCRPLTNLRSGVRLIAQRGVLEPREAASDAFGYIPFEVPDGAAGVTVTLAYDGPGPTDRRGVGSILDLGLFGPGSLAIGTPTFRGWSGSERAQIVVAERAATPGYLAGPIHAGRCRYQVTAEPLMAGDHRLAALLAACEAAVDPAVDAIAPTPVDGRSDGLDPSADPWWPGDLHCQTVHSDGKLTVARIARFARAAGLAFLFVSDHNTTSHRAELAAAGSAAAIALHPAEEVTTYRGHMGALGASGWVDFRQRDTPDIAREAEAVRTFGGMTVRNHPASTSSGWEFGPVTDAFEVWNGPWDGRNRNERALTTWAQELATGRRTVAVGGSDMHDVRPDRQPIGTPITWVRSADPGQVGILGGLRAGSVALSRTVAGPYVDLLVSADDASHRSVGIGASLAVRGTVDVDVSWRVRAAAGSELRVLALDTDDATGTLQLRPVDRSSFIRAEVRARDGALLAMANPIYLEESA